MTRVILIVAISVILWTYATAAETTKITYWHGWGGDWSRMPEELVGRFHAAYPEIEVEISVITGDLVEQLTTAMIAGVAPDAITVWGANQVVALAATEMLTPLHPADEQEVRNWVYEPFLELGMWENRIYGLSYWQQSTALAWRTEDFAAAGLDPRRPPETLQELEQYAKNLTRRSAGGEIVRMGFFPNNMYHWIGGFGGSLYDVETRRVTADSPQNIAALNWMAGFRREYGLDHINQFYQTPRGDAGFARGDISMTEFGGAWQIGNFASLEMRDDEWGLGAMPSAPEVEGHVTYSYGDFTVVPRTSAHPEAAWKFVKFISGVTGEPEDYAATLFWHPLYSVGAPINLPVSLRAYQSAVMQSMAQEWPKFVDLINFVFADTTRVVYPPKTPIFTEYGRILGEAYANIMAGEIDAQTALEDVARVVQSLEDEYWASR